MEFGTPFAIACLACRAVFAQAQQEAQPQPTVNFPMVLVMIVAGVGVVMGVPYVLFGKSGKTRSWAEQLEDSRKQRVGHVL